MGEVTSLRAFVLTFCSGGRGHGGLFFGVQQVSLPVQLSSISVFCVCVGVGAGVVRFLCFISAKKWELPVFPVRGNWIPAVERFAGGGGMMLLLSPPEWMPMDFQRHSCGLAWFWARSFCGLTCVGPLRQRQQVQEMVGGERRLRCGVALAGKSWKLWILANKLLYFFVFFFCFQDVDGKWGCTVI